MSSERAEISLLLTVPAAAKTLGIGIRTLRSALAGGQVRSIEIGRRRLIPRREIERLTESNEND